MPNLPTSPRRNSCNVTPAKCTEKKVVAYYTNWGIYDRNYQPMDVAADKITHINYAFVDLKENCSVELYDPWSDVDKNFQGGCVDAQPWGEQNRGNFDALKQLRSKYPHLKILLSFGGWTLSTYFSSCTKNQQTRDSVAKQIGEIVEKFEMDGADLDWEYPGFPGMEGNTQDPADPENYLLLIKEIRNHMGAGKPVTIASGMNPEYIEMMSQNNVLQRLCEELDWVNLMTYDYAGSWNNYTGHLAPLHPSGNDLHRAGWDIASGVDMMIQAGCPAEKMVLGLPFYGRSWTGVRPGNSNGLFVMEAEPGCGSFEPANRDFTDIDLNMVGKDGYVRYWDDVCKVPYLYKESTGEFVTYDDEESIGYKVKYANEMNLGGVMFWELSNDREEKLLDTITGTLDGCTQNPEPSPVTQAPAPATCVAIPNNPHWATDDSCAQCATGYEWWPCNMAGACDCSGLRRRTFDIQV
jgi:chitinase